MIRVAYIGNFKHAHCTEVAVAWALEQNGCTVDRIQQEHAVQMRPWREHGHDLFLYTRTHNQTALDQTWTDTWRALEGHGAVTASIHLDRFFDLERESLIHDRDPLFTTGHVFTADGGNQDRFAAAGVNHHWMPPAMDARELGPHGRDNRFTFDVVFVGSREYHYEYPQRGDLIRFLADRYGSRFARFGAGQRVVRGAELNALYASAKVIVGDSCFANYDSPRLPVRSSNYWSDRIPETLGRGGFLIHPWVPGLAADYETGRHLVTHVPGDWEDLDAQIGSYLAAPGERTGIQEQAIAHVAEHHTWTVRMRELLCTVGLCAEEAAA